MGNPGFPILGTEIPPMLGRARIMQRMWRDLTKPTPSHLSVVGPRFAGKSVLLNALAEQMCSDDSPYCTVIPWDLGHQTPQSDEQFLKLLCKRLGEGIKVANRDYGEHLLCVESGEYAEICEVMDALHSDGEKLLMLWDGFDKPLSGGTLTRNLWDNLLDLCRKPSFRLVTSTRRELHQLIRDEKSVTSDFWGVFEGVVRITTFDDADIEAILGTLPEMEFLPGAKTELVNWSGGFPPFLLEILNQIAEETDGGQIDNKMVNQAAVKAREKRTDMLSALWEEECSVTARNLYLVLVERRELPLGETGKVERMSLIEKGFAVLSGNKVRPSCRILQEHIQDAGPDAGSMARLFGSWDDYQTNIRGLLERRLAHISRFDDRLYRYVEMSISLLPSDPELSLNNLTSIRDRALDLVWQREFGQDKVIPQDIIDYWDQVNPYDNAVQRAREQPENIVPEDRGLQCGILQLLTGSKQHFQSKAKCASKDTYVLINAIQSYRNRTQHPEGQDIHIGVAVAAMMCCLELLSCLDRELE